MNQQALLDTLERLRKLPREAATVEFKLNWDHAPDIGQYISALGNSAALDGHDRAWLVWGVDNKKHEVHGTTFNPFTAKGEGNQCLIDGMVRLRMIDQIGSGIRRMFETQRERFFPLPDYLIEPDSHAKPRVEVSVSCKIMDANYTQALMKRPDLELHEVLLLDRVQKHQRITQIEAKLLKGQKLIEGRSPNYYISAKVADWAGQKARYIRTRALDDDYYKRLVVEYLQKFKRASRKELNDLLLPKLSDALTPDQKAHKVRNLI